MTAGFGNLWTLAHAFTYPRLEVLDAFPVLLEVLFAVLVFLCQMKARRNKASSAVSGTQVLAERSSREGSAQRMPRQPSASRLQKTGASGKNSGGGNST
uniref:Uncharacterized protein n=1 Tax=Bubo bubo TaxID=30461 RepID=A0A8C0IHK7_BUBBB